MAAITTTTTISTNTASKVASNLGISYSDAIQNLNNNRSPIISMNENPHPSNYVTNGVARVIQLLTYYGGNINNNSIAVEKYSISPNFTGLIKCSGPQKGIWYLPFPNTVYAIKFYGPDEYDAKYYNHVYAVPAKIDSSYWTGLKDYTTAVPQEWITAFVQYASTIPSNITPATPTLTPILNAVKSFPTTDATQKYQFSFNFWGSLSGTIGKASSFAFEYVFYPGTAPKPPVVGTVINADLNTFLSAT